MRIRGQEIKPVWLIGGGIAVVFLIGLFYDVSQTYFRKKSLERTVYGIAESAASYLPYRPADAVTHALAKLNQEGLKSATVLVKPDGSSIEISVSSDVTAYFAWIVGSSRLSFQAKKTADVIMEGDDPVDELSRGEVAFALVDYKDFKFLENLVIWPSGDTGAPDYGVKAHVLMGAESVAVGQKVTFGPLASFEKYSSPAKLFVAILGPAQDGTAVVQGFAALDGRGIDEEGRIIGQFIKQKVSGEVKKKLPQENSFGLVRGGQPRVIIK